MDRERKLLYTVVILAPILEALSIFDHYNQPNLPERTAAILEVRACQKQLAHSWAHCEAKHIAKKNI
jgi:hypothetical protein